MAIKTAQSTLHPPVNTGAEIEVHKWTQSARDKVGVAWAVTEGGALRGTLWSTGSGRWFAQTVAEDKARYGRIEQADNPGDCVRYIVNRDVPFDPATLTVE